MEYRLRMRPARCAWHCLLFGAVGLALPVAAASGQSYSFTSVADNSSTFSTFSAPSISGDGAVAFLATLRSGASGVFVASDGEITTIADDRGVFARFSHATPPINSDRMVAFVAKLVAGGDGVFAGSGGPITTIADRSGSFRSLSSSFAPSINGNGTVAFFAFPELASAGEGIFAGSGGAIATIADTRGDFRYIGAPSINTAGTVAFPAELDVGGQGIFAFCDGETTMLADTSGPLRAVGSPSINDAGTVVFYAELDAGGTGIFRSSGTTISTIADSSGPFRFFSYLLDPAINSSGAVAFFAELDAGGEGIFTGADPVADKIVTIGDSIFGSTVTALDFFRALNDGGDVAFSYELASGVRGVAVARAMACAPDCDGDGTLSFFDFLCFQNLFSTGDPAADCDNDGDLTFFDFLCFQDLFIAGCE
jgi:hypothetical protein